MPAPVLANPIAKVLETPAADPSAAREYFLKKLGLETDPSDVYHDLKNGVADFLLVDTRSPESYAKGHIPGAVNLWHRTIDAAATKGLSRDETLVVYCSGAGCNASTKGAARLADLGFSVKEMTGGLEWWKNVEAYPVATGPQPGRL